MEHPPRFGRYQVKGVIGKGAMGVIYLAEDPVIGRQVAIKVIQLNPGLSTEDIEGLKTRFEREFRSAGTLSHPNIVTVHDVGTEGDAPFIAMEYVPGKTLEHLINEQRALSFDETAEMIAQICDALDFAHQHGVVHRDIKPANILLDRTQRPKITDFGVAKLTESGMTHTGAMVGTPWYMSPEQVVGEPVTGAADQFSMAVMVYQLLTRERPFSGERSSTVLYKIVHEEPVRPHLLNPRLMDRLDEVLMRAFQKNPGQRYPTCTAFAIDLQEALGVADPRSRSKADAPLPATEWPTAALKLDAKTMQELQSAARSGAGTPGGSGSGSAAGSGSGSRAGSGAGSRAGSRASSAAGSRAESAARSAAGSLSGAEVAGPTAAPGEVDVDSGAATLLSPSPARPAAKAPASRGGMRGVHWAIAGVLAALALGLGVVLMGRGGDSSPDPGTETLVADAAVDAGAVSGAAVDGAGDASPGAGDLAAAESGDAGQAAPGDGTGAPAVAAEQTFSIVTRPPGATVLLDGEALEQVTPAEVVFTAGGRHNVRIELEGHQPVGWTFNPERLSADQLRTRTLFFPLAAIATVADAGAGGPAAGGEAAPMFTAAEPLPIPEGPTSPPGSVDSSLRTIRPGRNEQPRRIVDAAPVYDHSLVPAKGEPVVILELTVDPRGEVAEAKVRRRLTPELDLAAQRAAYQWRYEPTVHRGKPVNVVLSTTVRFTR